MALGVVERENPSEWCFFVFVVRYSWLKGSQVVDISLLYALMICFAGLVSCEALDGLSERALLVAADGVQGLLAVLVEAEGRECLHAELAGELC